MNLDKTATSLKKINRLFDLINEMGEGSSTETDLLKAYIKDLYIAVSDGEALNIAIPAASPPPAPHPKVVAIPKASPPVLKTANNAAIPVAMAAHVTEQVAVSSSELSTNSNGEFDDLFDLESGTELSDKLSATPIKDLTKSISINEKIFTINELFGGKNDEFNNMLVVLNGLNSFEEAKEILENSVAVKYKWNKKGVSKKAKNFIKLVARRYM